MISKVDMYLVSLLDVSIYHLYQSIIHLIYNYTFKYINIHGAYYFIGLQLFTPLSDKESMFTAWMNSKKRYLDGQDLTYAKYLSKFVYVAH